MSATDTKMLTVPMSGTINEFLHEAMRSYEKALKSGMQLQEELVNFWIDLLTKFDPHVEHQAKRESMTMDVFPAAPAVPVLPAIEIAMARKASM